NRFHFGHRPQRRVMFTPLNSILVDALTLRSEVSSRQHYYDIMESLSPGLSKYAYDMPEKSPTPQELDDLTIAPYEVSRDGKIYGVDNWKEQPRENGENAYVAWLAECEVILQNDSLQEILGSERLATCSDAIVEARQSNKPLRANHPGIIALASAYNLGFALDIPLSTLR